MKKKMKLFMTLASFCLAVAMLAFGVYAATSVTYNVGGSVSYTVNDVLVTFDSTAVTYTYSSTETTAPTTAPASVAETTCYNKTLNDTTGTSAKSWAAVSNGASCDWATHTDGVASSSTSHDVTGIAVKFNASFLWKVVISFKNDSTANAVNVAAALTNPTNGKVTAVSGNSATCAASATWTGTYFITLTSAATNASGNWKVALTISK